MWTKRFPRNDSRYSRARGNSLEISSRIIRRLITQTNSADIRFGSLKLHYNLKSQFFEARPLAHSKS